jgi:hypothetical protein
MVFACCHGLTRSDSGNSIFLDVYLSQIKYISFISLDLGESKQSKMSNELIESHKA